MSAATARKSHILLLFVVALVPRVIGAFWLPNAFGDAYAYTEQIYYMRRALLSGSFHFSNLFGFWLPLYQLICASVSALVGNPFYVPKLISAISGAGVCTMVFLLTRQLTANNQLSLAGFAVVALNPYHVLYSSSTLTDVPNAFLILLCAYCCVKDRWLAAAVCALLAGLMRIESWSLIAVIPLLQMMKQRRVSPLACVTLLLGPLFWLFVSWRASGSLWKYFEIRNSYIVETVTSNPWLASFAPMRVGLDFVRLVYTLNPLVLIGCFVALLTFSKVGVRPSGLSFSSLLCGATRGPLAVQARRLLFALSSLPVTSDTTILVIFFSHLGFLLLAYFTGNQPEIWPRYGLIFFTLGLPIFAKQTYFMLPLARSAGKVSRAFLAPIRFFARPPLLFYVTAVVFVVQFCIQLVDVTRIVVKSDPNKIAAEFLEDQHAADSSLKIYCEDGAIRVLSGIPLEDFRDQYNSPADTESFLRSLRENQIRFLVYKDLPGSRLKEIIRQMKSGKLDVGRSGITLEEVTAKPRQRQGETIVLYRVHESELALKSGRMRRDKSAAHD